MSQTTSTIFVQIASYRDPELIPTLRDLIGSAAFPDRLRIVVCWQHGPDEHVGIFLSQQFLQWELQPGSPFNLHTFTFGGARIELIDVPHEQSQGACWARNQIQQRYRDEAYTLQLDSHHRFVANWDTAVIGMLEQLRPRSPKPLLTAYLSFYTPPAPDTPFIKKEEPALGMSFDRFSRGGPILFRSFTLPNWRTLHEPVPARFYSGHFAFADGAFAREVQHDPDYFFHGEEISIAVRAFTHGYDLYHPHRTLAWHEYVRDGRRKIWDDHDKTARDDGRVRLTWSERNDLSMARNRVLFGMEPEAGDTELSRNDPRGSAYGFGTARSLADYEVYAGISFRDRAVQPEVLAHAPPDLGAVRPGATLDRATLRRSNDVRVVAHHTSIDVAACPRATRCTVQALRDDGTVLHEDDADIEAARQHCHGEWFDRDLAFMSDLGVKPAAFRIELRDAHGETLKAFTSAVG